MYKRYYNKASKLSIEKTLKELSVNGINVPESWFRQLDASDRIKQLEIICKNYQIKPIYNEELQT